MLGTFVALNITIKDRNTGKTFLLNPSLDNSPLIYWWNKRDNFIETMLSDLALKEYLQAICTEDEDSYGYETGKISCFYLDDEDTEEYSTKEIAFQDIFPVTILKKNIYYNYFLDILKELYKDVYKESYENNEECIPEDLDEQVRDIYNKIISGVKRTILLQTVTNYLYKTIKERTNLSNENITQLIKIFNNIIERTQ